MSFLSNLFGGKPARSPAAPAPKPSAPIPATMPAPAAALPGSAVSPTGKTPALRIEIDEQGIAIVVDAAAADRAKILLAAENCPTQAIRLYELQGQRVYPDWLDGDSVAAAGGGGAALG